MKNKLHNIHKHYSTLTVQERASLMITAWLKDDDSEFNKLQSSSETKSFISTGHEERKVYLRWLYLHFCYITEHFNALKTALRAIHNNEHEEIISYAVKRLAAKELAFLDFAKTQNLPIYTELLLVSDALPQYTLEPFARFILEFSCGDDLESVLRECDKYGEILSLFTALWEQERCIFD